MTNNPFKTLNPAYLPFGNKFPIEIQELILEERDSILEKERKAIIESLSFAELLSELDKKLVKYLPMDETQQITFKGPHQILSIKKFDIHDTFDAINLSINVENHEEVSHGIVDFWNTLTEPQQYMIAGDCFDSIETQEDIVFRGDDDDFMRYSMYCFNHMKKSYDNNFYRIVDNQLLVV